MKILVVDDEKPARDRLRQLVGDLDDYEIVGEAANGRAAIEACQDQSPDVVLMDIRMPGMDGIEAARHLSQIEDAPAVIFATAYNEYALAAFDAQAIGYLMKPIRRERLQRALEHARRLGEKQLDALREEADEDAPRTHLSARVGDRLRLIRVDDILYFQADQKYVAVGLPNEEVLIDDSLKSIETEFGKDVFFRIHRNALVALAHLRAIEKQKDGSYRAHVRDSDKTLAISRRHVAGLRKLIRAG
jgi:two-component system response regulator AlgR